MSQNSTAQPRHTLRPEHLRILAELMARERNAELVSAYGVTPEGEKIDLLRPGLERNRGQGVAAAEKRLKT